MEHLNIDSLEPRFREKIHTQEGCWLWMATLNFGGYGVYQKGRRKKAMAHRFAWEHFNGKIPPGLLVLHKCDVRNCVNPSHLFLGTQQDNMDDMVRKKRQGDVKGENNSRAKLTESDVKEIRSRFQEKSSRGTQKKLAAEYGVAPSTISNILRGYRWTKKDSTAVTVES